VLGMLSGYGGGEKLMLRSSLIFSPSEAERVANPQLLGKRRAGLE